MKLKSVKISGFQAVSPDRPAEFTNLSEKNIFIGPNNAGKSILFRCLNIIKMSILEWDLEFYNEACEEKGLDSYNKRSLLGSIRIPDFQGTAYWWKHDASKEGSLTVDIEVRLNEVEALAYDLSKHQLMPLIVEATPGEFAVKFSVEFVPTGHLLICPMFYKNEKWIRSKYLKNDRFGITASLKIIGHPNTVDLDDGTLARFIRLISDWAASMRFFDAVRSLQRPVGKAAMEDGSGVLRELKDWSNKSSTHNDWAQFRRHTIAEINKLLIGPATAKIENLEIVDEEQESKAAAKSNAFATKEMPSRFKQPSLHLELNGISLELSGLGSGVAELILILIAISKDRHIQKIYFIEEPESHLHPGLFRRFLDQLSGYSNLQLFINTHSNAVLDCLSDADRLFHVSLNSAGETEISDCREFVELSSIIDALGIRASSLLQTNCSIWIEGPSDRLYIRQMLSELADEKGERLIEGSDYSFILYGGKNLSHFECDYSDSESNDLVSMLNVSRYSAVIMDRDDLPCRDSASLRTTKTRVLGECSKDPRHRFAAVTANREMELEIPRQLLLDVVAETFKITGNLLNGEVLSQEKSFAQEIADILAVDGEAEKIAKRISQKKVVIASAVVEHCKKGGFSLSPYPPWLRQLYDFVISTRNV